MDAGKWTCQLVFGIAFRCTAFSNACGQARSCVQGLPHLQMFSQEAESAAYKAREVLLAAAGACSSVLLTEVRRGSLFAD